MLVSFRIGKYEDEVLCDVAPMDAGHFLLGRSWQFDRRVVHDGYTNKYSLMRNNRTITLVPLTLQHVHEDQVKLQQERVKPKESMREKESERQKRAKEIQK